MSGYTFRRAVREKVQLIIGLSGGTGSGKTMSAMRMAKGMAHGKPFCVIDTENGRASHYADQFVFDVLDLRAPFSPERYSDAIAAADKAGYHVIVVDSMSHVWAGDGGVLDWQEAELERMAGQDYQRREACKMAAWIKPKLAHKHMMSTLLQVKAHIILAFRAEEKIEMVKVNGKMEVRKKESLVGKDGWVPICDKNVPFECTCSFLLLASNPGIPHPIKLQEQHKKCFDPNGAINEFAGEQLAKWALGGSTPQLVEEKAQPDGLEGSRIEQTVRSEVRPQQDQDAAAPLSIDLVIRDLANAPDTAAKSMIFNEAMALGYPEVEKKKLLAAMKGKKP